MTNKNVQMAWRSRVTVAVGLGLTVAAAACSGGVSPATSPSGVTPSSLEASGGQSTRNFSVTVTPTEVQVGETTLKVTITRNETSGQSQKLGSAEIYVPSGFTIQSVSNLSNNWTSAVSGQTVRVGTEGNHKLDGAAGRTSVTFDINVTSTRCETYVFTAKAANSAYSDSFDPNWNYTGSALSVTVTNCVQVEEECKAAPAVANEYLKSIDIRGRDREKIIEDVAHHMTQDAPRFDGIDPCNVEAYRNAVVAFVDSLLNSEV